ncbi:hypothetical protein Tco_0683834 [Tanacetum coccineum]
MNSWYAGLAASNARLREKVKCKNKKLRDHLAEAEAAAARSLDELARTDAKDAAATVEHRFNDLRSEVAHFVSSDIDSLVQRFLSIDEFNATLASILYLAITSGVKRGLRMGRTDVEFKKASQNVFHFFIGAEAEFNKAVDALPST